MHGGNYQRATRRGTVYWYFNGWEQAKVTEKILPVRLTAWR